jgi:REP element-mobilizing transposase RayT
LIPAEFKEELHKYITGIVRNKGQKLISINGMSDHLHILIGLRPAMALAHLVRDIKSESSEWVNRKKLSRGKFAWQEDRMCSRRPSASTYIPLLRSGH